MEHEKDYNMLSGISKIASGNEQYNYSGIDEAQSILSDPKQKEYPVMVGSDVVFQLFGWLKNIQYKQITAGERLKLKKRGLPDPNHDLLPLVMSECNRALDREVVDGCVEMRLNVRSVLFLAQMYDDYLSDSKRNSYKKRIKGHVYYIAQSMVYQNIAK